MSLTKTNILGVRLDKSDWDSILKKISEAVSARLPFHIVTLNGEIALSAKKNPDYLDILNSSDLTVADSINILLAANQLGLKTTKTPGSELVVRLSQFAEAKEFKIFLLGGRGDVPKKATDKLKSMFPKLNIVGFSNKDPNDISVLEEITKASPNIVLVAYGSPRQEKWIFEHKNSLPPAVFIGIGGTFDTLAGRIKPPPKVLKRLHLEWFWRLLLEPSRFPRIIKAVIVFPGVFCVDVLLQRRKI